MWRIMTQTYAIFSGPSTTRNKNKEKLKGQPIARCFHVKNVQILIHTLGQNMLICQYVIKLHYSYTCL